MERKLERILKENPWAKVAADWLMLIKTPEAKLGKAEFILEKDKISLGQYKGNDDLHLELPHNLSLEIRKRRFGYF